MKAQIRTLTSAFVAFLPISTLANFSPHPGFEQLSDDHPEAIALSEARRMAINFIRKAATTSSFNEQKRKDIAAAAIDKLSIAKIYVSVNPFNVSCHGNRAYVDQKIPNSIFICDQIRGELMNKNPETLVGIAQDLIHESIHLLGSRDECIATNFELTVMKEAIGWAKTNSLNGYGASCGGFNEFKSITGQRLQHEPN